MIHIVTVFFYGICNSYGRLTQNSSTYAYASKTVMHLVSGINPGQVSTGKEIPRRYCPLCRCTPCGKGKAENGGIGSVGRALEKGQSIRCR